MNTRNLLAAMLLAAVLPAACQSAPTLAGEVPSSPVAHVADIGADISTTVTYTAALRPSPSPCLYGCPKGGPRSNVVVRHQLYTFSNNAQTKFADWVAYVVTDANQSPEEGNRNWQPDPVLDPEVTLEEDDYNGAAKQLSIDMGHQAPLKSFTGSKLWPQTNYLSNITPQDLNLNRGRWLRLEIAERALALDRQIGDVFVITGPLYERKMPKLPMADERHQIPSGYWKVVALDTGEVVGFIFQQFASEGTYCDRIVPISTIEKRAKLNLFPEVQLRSLKSLKERIGC